MVSRSVSCLVLASLLWAAAPAHGHDPDRQPVAATPHFAFYSDFEFNLNDALIAAGTERRFGRPELFQAGPEKDCFDAQRSPARAAWDAAVDYHAEIVSPQEFDDQAQLLLRGQLAGFAGPPAEPLARQYLETTAHLRAAAAPVYRACRWPAQDAKNRTWISAVLELLGRYERPVAARLETLYHKSWTGLPIPLDVVETVSWSGANTIILEPGGHIQVATSYTGPGTLEIVFHEASHLLMGRGDPVQQALVAAAREHGADLPRGLWHVVLFFTTGETVRRVLAGAGQDNYTPMIYGIYERSPWGRYREPMETHWPAYISGALSLTEASLRLVRAIGSTPARDGP